MISTLIKYWKEVLIGIVFITLAILLINSSPKYIGHPLYQDRIDTAEQRIKDSLAKIKYYQMLDSMYNRKLDTIQTQLDGLQVIKPQIRNYYTTNINQVDKYTPKDIDTFFKNRYRY